ncbi:alpha-L-fucosidase [Microlunatus elymi]|uniref:alpha-L-fucosidase n=1 Tax=Microlunatus elymi TaxID=2596828 RepID=A0A516Q128_9ACTN|nr:alpha-L-fucosidase [Microlunatus elymi]QDP97139.1 alpha-L-fucosidase [Microlunatus elymi]
MPNETRVADQLPMIPPTPGQLAWQRQELGVFFHFGVNTFAALEWSDGTLPASSFNPTDLDARQWVATAADAGARYVVLTAKHHDGFCLWPTETTDYSVASSPWRDGQGDVVAEVAAAAEEYGLDLGLYLSPWDRNAACYPDKPAYDRFYQDQLRELCTRYGKLTELWFDGAGSQGREYDWVGIGEVIKETQPDAMIFNMGAPTIRWVGNEDGLAADPVNYVVAETDFSQYTTYSTQLAEALYLPPECDVSIRKGWFWADRDQPKSLDHLLGIYYRSVGMGANLLLNLPPDNRGLIPDADVERLRQWRSELDQRFAEPIEATVTKIDSDGDSVTWRADFTEPAVLDHLELVEDYRNGQRVRAHRVQAGDRTLADGLTIGNKRLHAFDELQASAVEIVTTGADPVLAQVRGYRTGFNAAPQIVYRASTEAPDDAGH